MPFLFFSRVVKEEIVDDDAHLPCFNGRVVSWVRSLLSTCTFESGTVLTVRYIIGREFLSIVIYVQKDPEGRR